MDKDSESLVLAYVGRCCMCNSFLPTNAVRLSKKLFICPTHDSIDRVLHFRITSYRYPSSVDRQGVRIARFNATYGESFHTIHHKISTVLRCDRMDVRPFARTCACVECAERTWSWHGVWRCARCPEFMGTYSNIPSYDFGNCVVHCRFCWSSRGIIYECYNCGMFRTLAEPLPEVPLALERSVRFANEHVSID